MTMDMYLIYLGLVLLSLTLDKHYRKVLNEPVSNFIKRVLGVFGTLILIISLIIAIKSSGLSLGLTYWVGMLVPAIVFIALVFTYKPKIIVILSVVLLLITIFL